MTSSSSNAAILLRLADAVPAVGAKPPRTQALQLQSLQVLRALAATSVVYFHLGRAPQFGSFGVDLFFVLSGFVIAMIAAGETHPLAFALSRITRVAPLYWILTTAVLVLAALAPHLLTATSVNAGDYLRSIFFVPYFKSSGALQPMLGVGWTLNYEILFYFLTTLSLLIWRAGMLPFSITALVLASWLLGRSLDPHSAYGSFLSSDLLFEFVLGVIAWNTRDLALWRHMPRALLLALLLVSYALLAYFDTRAVGYHLLAFGIPACIIVGSAYQLEPLVQALPARLRALLVHVGDASYATYLSHLFCIDFVKRVLSHYVGDAVTASALGATTTLLVSLAVGSAVYLLIDKPAVRGARRLVKRLRQPRGQR